MAGRGGEPSRTPRARLAARRGLTRRLENRLLPRVVSDRMEPVQVVRAWVARFNDGDVEGLMDLYAEDAVNHQVVMEPLRGRSEIREMFEAEFERAEMTCIPEKLHDAGEWAILEWSDPNGLQGCGFFHVVDGQIVLQRGYFDQLTFFRGQGLPVPESYLGDG